MTKTKTIKLSALLITSTLMVACGRNDVPRGYDPYGYNQAGLGICQVPPGQRDRAVMGSFGKGATLRLDIYKLQGGGIGAFGDLNIPSAESLFGMDIFTGGFETMPPGGYGYSGPYTQIKSCVSTNGAIGDLAGTGTYQDINVALQGNNGVSIQMGSGIGVRAYLSGDRLLGTVQLKVGNYPQSEFILAP